MNTMRRASAAAAVLMLAIGVGAAPAAFAAQTQTRAFRQSFPTGGTVRLANLAGRVDLVRGQGKEVVVEATVHADAGGETQKLLQGMKWVKSRDREGHEEWALSYPVEKHRSFVYPRKGTEDSAPAFLSFLDMSQTVTTYRGEKVKVYARPHGSAPTLYTDLRISLPVGSDVVFRNAIGVVRGGDLEGSLSVKTGSGDVQIASYAGRLTVDTGSGDVIVGAARGETSIDTGSGDVVVKRLIGNGSMDTGSGDVIVENVSAGKLAVDTGSGDVTVREGTAAHVLAETGSGSVRVIRVELEELDADTGSGDVVLQASLAKAKRVSAETGSGDVEIKGGPDASFDISSSHGSGELQVGYADAAIRKSGKKVVGAKRGNGQTVIRVATGSGDCVISPRERS
ncbi:MAG TPA: DUF4097 family beta strand repeat-containing protein [Thermoanaerobaculia bacterium]|nr:DUF4097 family beta strand repeat-containing protein [Thermoanaerobaculia bacterium]